MRLAVVASTLILVTTSAWSCALAQGTPSREAPVGHRQPKATEVPPDQETAFEKKFSGQDESRVYSDGLDGRALARARSHHPLCRGNPS